MKRPSRSVWTQVYTAKKRLKARWDALTISRQWVFYFQTCSVPSPFQDGGNFFGGHSLRVDPIDALYSVAGGQAVALPRRWLGPDGRYGRAGPQIRRTLKKRGVVSIFNLINSRFVNNSVFKRVSKLASRNKNINIQWVYSNRPRKRQPWHL